MMPLVLKNTLPSEGVLGIWFNTEGDDYFEQRLDLYPSEVAELSQLKARKKSEWLCSRYLLHILSGRHDRGACLKDSYGKPYLQDSDFDISISHTDQYTGIIAGPYRVGLDIQIFVDKIKRIRSKFVRQDESQFIDEDQETSHLLTIWGAKEAMYKAYGKKELDFKQHMKVFPFAFNEHNFAFEGLVHKGDFYQKYQLNYQNIELLTIVYAIESK